MIDPDMSLFDNMLCAYYAAGYGSVGGDLEKAIEPDGFGRVVDVDAALVASDVWEETGDQVGAQRCRLIAKILEQKSPPSNGR